MTVSLSTPVSRRIKVRIKDVERVWEPCKWCASDMCTAFSASDYLRRVNVQVSGL